jgi:hypothetical protein
MDSHGQPVIDAQVAFVRQSGRLTEGRGQQTAAHDTTTALGEFTFGWTPLNTTVDFPLETFASFEYLVRVGGESREIAKVEFSAPRVGTAVQSVYATIHLK